MICFRNFASSAFCAALVMTPFFTASFAQEFDSSAAVAATQKRVGQAPAATLVRAHLAESLIPSYEPLLKRRSFNSALELCVDAKDVDALRKIVAQEKEHERLPGTLKSATDALNRARAELAAATSLEEATKFADEILETDAAARDGAPQLLAILGRAYPELGADCLDRYVARRLADENATDAEKENVELAVKVAKYQIQLLAALDSNDAASRERLFEFMIEDAKKNERFAKKALAIYPALRRQYRQSAVTLCEVLGQPTPEERILEFRERCAAVGGAPYNPPPKRNPGKPRVSATPINNLNDLSAALDERQTIDEAPYKPFSKMSFEEFCGSAKQINELIADVAALDADGALTLSDSVALRSTLRDPVSRFCQNLPYTVKEWSDADPAALDETLKSVVGWLKVEELLEPSWAYFVGGILVSYHKFNPKRAESLFDEADAILAPYASSPNCIRPIKNARFRLFHEQHAEFNRDATWAGDLKGMMEARGKFDDAFFDRAEKDPLLALELKDFARGLVYHDAKRAARATRIWLDAYKSQPDADQALVKQGETSLAMRELFASAFDSDESFLKSIAALTEFKENQSLPYYQEQCHILEAFRYFLFENVSPTPGYEGRKTAARGLGSICLRLSETKFDDPQAWTSAFFLDKSLESFTFAGDFDRILELCGEEERRETPDPERLEVARKYAKQTKELLERINKR